METFEQRPIAGQDIDADVVCAACGLENDHGTLICRQCGNNLRDQRRKRLTEMATGMATEQKTSRLRLLSGLLSLLGLLLVVGVALNLEALTNVLSGGTAQADTGALAYWRGGSAATFDAMLQNLENRAPTMEQRTAAIATPLATDTVSGRYVLAVTGDTESAPTQVGVASVTVEDGTIFFCALLDRGGEVRGVGQADETGRVTCQSAGIENRRSRAEGVGYAIKNAQGGYSIYGAPMGEGQGGNFEVLAYPIAE